MDGELEKLLRNNPALWRGHDTASSAMNGIKTGFTQLDAILPWGGWPSNALVEVVTLQWGIGELQLLLPAMARLSRQGYWVIWIAPPYVPHAPALMQGGVDLNRTCIVTLEDARKDVHWSMEKVLRTDACCMALAWPGKLAHHSLRRLQLAAETGNSLGVVFRSTDTGASSAALRIRLSPENGGLKVRVLKARGGYRRRDSVHLSL